MSLGLNLNFSNGKDNSGTLPKYYFGVPYVAFSGLSHFIFWHAHRALQIRQ